MEIVWYGLNCFRLSERGMASVVTDPCDPDTGLELPRLRADIVTISRETPECSYVKAIRGTPRRLDTPGEYEIGGVFITGISTFADKKKGATRGLNTIYHFDYDGISVCHLGHLGHVPTQAQIEALGAVNVLMVPVGGDGGLTPSEASEVISLLEPGIVIPMRYKLPGVTLSLGTLNRFLKQVGAEKIQPQESIKISQSSLPDETEIVILEPRAE